MATSRICSIPDCGKPAEKRGWCSTHYSRWRIHGDPTYRKRVGNGEVARYFHEIVIPYDGDECLIWPYATLANGYAEIRHAGTMCLVSRLKAAGRGPLRKAPQAMTLRIRAAAGILDA